MSKVQERSMQTTCKEDGCVSIDPVKSWLTPAIKNGGREPTPEPELALATAHVLRTPR